jgi:hypothetical protein
VVKRGKAGVFEPVEKWLKARVRHPRYRHVFHGDVNMHAVPGPRGTGFHHRHNGWNPPGARVRTDADGMEMILERNDTGTYRARVDVQGPDGNWYQKRGSSSFFPDSWHPQQVDHAINDAFRNRRPHPTEPDKWIGSSNGLDIEGFYSDPGQSHWHSAWPTN